MALKFSKLQKQAIFEQAKTFWQASTDSSESFFSNVTDRERMARNLLPQSIVDIYAKHPDKSCLIIRYRSITIVRERLCRHLANGSNDNNNDYNT